MLHMDFGKHPSFPDAPLAFDLAASGTDRQLVVLVLTPQLMGRPLVAPPGIWAERLKTLPRAFNLVMKDELLLAQGHKQALEVPPVEGAERSGVLDKVYGAPPELIARAECPQMGSGR